MKIRNVILGLLSTIGLTACYSMGHRVDHIAIAQITNIQGYNEPGIALLPLVRTNVSKVEFGTSYAYIVELYDSWLVLTGRPTKNPYWYLSSDSAVQIRLFRKIEYSHIVVPVDLLAALGASSTFVDVTEMVGHVSIENYNDGYLLYLDLHSKGNMIPNIPWLKSLSQSDQKLMVDRLQGFPGVPNEAIIKGSITAIKIFTGN